MPVIRQSRIYRADLQANPDVLYLFGDNDDRVGYGGQAREMRDEENAVGIRTKWHPSHQEDAFFADDDYDEIIGMIGQDIERARDHLENGGVVVIPLDGLGTGLSDLPNRAPRVLAYIEEQINEMMEIEGE